MHLMFCFGNLCGTAVGAFTYKPNFFVRSRTAQNPISSLPKQIKITVTNSYERCSQNYKTEDDRLKNFKKILVHTYTGIMQLLILSDIDWDDANLSLTWTY